MKKLRSETVQNILFTALVALAAVAIYLLIGTNGRTQELAASTPAPSDTPAPTDDAPEGFVPANEEAFLSRLGAASGLRVLQSAKPQQLTLVCGDEFTGKATLVYTLDPDGRVTAFTLTCPLIAKPTATPKTTKSTPDAFGAVLYEQQIVRQNDALQTMLLALFSAVDETGKLVEPIQMSWYTGALRARDNGKYYSDTFARCQFLAYPSQLAADDVILCSFIAG